MANRVGTSGWSYDAWKGRFYPDAREPLEAFAAADTGDPDKDPPLAAGGGWCYARLRREDYDEAALAEWADRLRALPVEDRYVFFRHEDEAAGPSLAVRFAEMLEAAA